MEKTIAERVEATGRKPFALAREAGIAPNTVLTAIRLNTWPPQKRTRTALAGILGIQGDPLAPVVPEQQPAGTTHG